MRKNVLIVGVPRAGKSTLASRLAKATGWQHLPVDMIVAGFERMFPETGIDTTAEKPSMEIYRTISPKLAPFIRGMIDGDEFEKFDHGVIFDVYQLTPEDYVKYVQNENTTAVFLGTADLTAEERFQLLKQYDTPAEDTYFYPDEENRQGCADIVEQSRMIREQCERLGLPYYETSRNREQVLEEIMQKMISEP